MEIKGLFIGLNTLDVQFHVNKYPGANEKIKASHYGMYTGGPATNAAITFAHLGGQPHLISSFGKHAFTEIIYKELQDFKVETTDMTPERICHPIFASILTTEHTGERSVVSYHPDHHNYCDITLENFPVDDYNIILTDGFYIDPAITLIKKSNGKIPVILDGGSWKPNLEKLLPFIDIAICSADFCPPGISNHEDIMNFLLSFGINTAVITRGGSDILVKTKPESYHIPVDPVKAIDTLGAGDVFHGAFCYYHVQNADVKKSLEDASCIASRSCLCKGTREWMKI